MEKRLLLAIVFSILLLLAWQLVFVKKAPEPVNPAEQSAKLETTPTQTTPEKKLSDIAASAQGAKAGAKSLNIKQIASTNEEQVTISTSLYQAVWTNKGGVLTSWKLHEHKNEKSEDLNLVPVFTQNAGVYPFSLLDESPEALKAGLAGITSSLYNSAFYKITGMSRDVKDGDKAELRFTFSDGKELEIEKVFTFYGGKYDFDVAVHILKDAKAVEPRLLWGPGIRDLSEAELKQSRGAGGGVSVLAAAKVHRIDERRYNPGQSAFNFVDWAAYDDNYFMALFLPAAGNGTAAFLKEDVENKGSYFFLAVNNPVKAFIGPKEFDRLVEFGHDAKKIIRYGFFGAISEILLKTIKFIHKFIPNWGLVIIIFGFLVKILLFPLTYSQLKSTAKMGELQPKVKALRAKYKKAKTDIAQRREMNEEMMKLYKEHGVNPAGGCLPSLLQIPFFFALYPLMTSAIELRQSPFVLWVKDLSLRETAFSPHLPIMAVMTGVAQYISQKMTPTSADPSQAKMMMMLMPVFITFIFMSLQSGLVLFWLTQNALQIGQQYIMNRMRNKKKVESHGKRRKK